MRYQPLPERIRTLKQHIAIIEIIEKIRDKYGSLGVIESEEYDVLFLKELRALRAALGLGMKKK